MSIRRASLSIVTALSALVLTAPAFAQDRPGSDQPQRRERPAPPRDRAQGQGAPAGRENPQGANMPLLEFVNQLDLTPEQRAEFKTIRETLQAKTRDAMAEAREKALAVLTPEQKAKVEDFMASRNAEAGGPMPLQRVEQAIQQLDLTPEQRQQIRQILGEYRPKFQAARQESGEDRAVFMEKARPLATQLTQDLGAVLTPEQRETFKQKMSENRPAGAIRPQGRDNPDRNVDGGAAPRNERKNQTNGNQDR